jgi:superoxide dismutase
MNIEKQQTAAEAIAANYGYGDVVTHEELWEYLGIEKSHDKMTQEQFEALALKKFGMIEQLKTELIHNHKICLANVRKVGYVLVNPSEQADYALRMTSASISNAIKKGCTIANNINMTILTSSEKKHAIEASNKISSLEMMIAQKALDLEALARVRDMM